MEYTDPQFEIIDRGTDAAKYLNEPKDPGQQAFGPKNELPINDKAFFKIFHAATNPMAITTIDEGCIIDLNEAFTQITGYRREELIGETTLEHGICRDLRQRDEVIRRLQKEGTVCNFETKVRTKNGDMLTILFSLDKISLGGEPYLLTVAGDISERKRAEEAIRESENRYRTAIEHCNDGVAIGKGTITLFVNQRYLEMFGYDKPEEIVGKPGSVVAHPDDINRMEAIMLARQRGEKVPSRYEIRGIRKNGEPIDIEISATRTVYGGEAVSLAYLRDITDRKKAEKKLRESEEKYRTLVEQSLQGLVIVQDGCFVFCNSKFCEITGYSVEELLSLSPENISAMIHIDNRELIEDRWRDQIAGKQVPSHYEYRSVKKDGTEIWLEIYSSIIEYNGKPAIQSAIMDITQHKRTAEALQQAEQKYRSIFEGALEGIFRATPDGRFLAANPSLAHMLGYSSPDEFIAAIKDIGRQLFVERERRKEYLHELRNQGIVRGFEFQAFRKNKSKIWLSIYTRAYSDSAGEISYYDGYVEDITEHKQADENLQRALDWQKAIFEGSRDAVIISDRNSKFMAANEEACKLTGYSKEELLNLGAWDLNKNVDPSELDVLRDRIFSGEDVLGETKIYTKDGREIDVEFGHRRVIISGELYIHSIARDIGNRKRLEAQLQQAQKMEAIGILAGGVAHDFNNLLNAINGYSELALEELASDNPIRKDLEQVIKAGKQATSLTSQLLSFSRKQILQPEIMNLNETVDEMSTMLRRLIGEDIRLVVNTQPNLGFVNADPAQLQQIIMNLSVNARDAMPEGGRLTIETANAEFDENYIRDHAVDEAGSYVMLAISDNGIGMDTATRARIFEPFFTTKSKGKGTGLGLSTIYGIVKQSNGFIWVYSEPGKGTTFKIYFPRVEGKKAPAAAENKFEAGFQGSESILVVEDEATVRALASRILRNRGYEVLEAADGMEALSISQQHAGEIHLVLTDVVMPGIGGKDLVSQLKAARPDIKALYVSGYTDNAIIYHGVLDRNVAFLQKPFTTDGLARKVREVIDHSV
jgi:two-component system cell cycle sensor histidine kinase/response regulator CckA